jgi:hypothetical protein
LQKQFRPTGRLPDRMDPLNIHEIGNDLNMISAATKSAAATTTAASN